MKHEKELTHFYGLKHNPFWPNLPIDSLWHPPGFDTFLSKVESFLKYGGITLITGENGLGKSKVLQLVAYVLSNMGDVVVGVMQRPQSSMGDFYREMGELFGLSLRPSNRYGGFKALRNRWRQHIVSTLMRPVLLIDEAQEVPSCCLNELRLLSSFNFDSECMMSIVLCGDTRLQDRLRTHDLLAIGSRIRTRYTLQPLERTVSLAFFDHLLQQAGAPHLFSDSLKQVLVDHSAGNPRILTNMASDLLETGYQQKQKTLDDELFFEVFALPKKRKSRGK